MGPRAGCAIALLIAAALRGCNGFSVLGMHHSARGVRCTRLSALEDVVPLPATEGIDLWSDKKEFESSQSSDMLMAWLPLFLPIAAFFGYDEVLSFITWAIDNGPGNWMAVDGGKKQVELLQPVINGVILPAVSIALGTLSATTINSLRDRQRQLRACLHKEACLLDLLLSGTLTIFDGRRRTDERRSALTLLKFYCLRLITESTARFDFDAVSRTGAADSELRAFVRLLHSSPPIRDSVDPSGVPLAFHEGALAGFERASRADARGDAPSNEQIASFEARVETAVEPRFTDATQFNMQINSKELMMIRSERLSLLQTSFPLEHWACMCLLGVSVVLCFLIETDEKTLQFLDLLQLRVIFTILIGALSGIASICVDLNDPFRGSFRITQSSAQLCECLPPIPFPRSPLPVPRTPSLPSTPLHAPRDRTVTAAEMLFFHSASHATASCLR